MDSDFENADLVVIYEKPTVEDLANDQLMQSRGAFFCKKELEKHFKNIYYTCVNDEIKQRLYEKPTIIFGTATYKKLGFWARDFEVGKIMLNVGLWSALAKFKLAGNKFLLDFNKFLERLKDATAKKDCR